MKLLLLLLALFAAVPCAAAPWIGASGSYNTYAMDDVNEDIAGFNSLSGLHMDELASGIGFGLSVGADADRWSFSIGYDRLPASTALEGVPGGPSYDLAANVFLARAACRLPLDAKFGVSIGIGAGIASASGEIGPSVGPLAKRVGPSTDAVIYEGGADASGSSFSYEGFVEGDVPLGGKFSVVPCVGYRSAKIEGEFSDGTNSSSKTFDFSGVAARLGLRFAL